MQSGDLRRFLGDLIGVLNGLETNQNISESTFIFRQNMEDNIWETIVPMTGMMRKWWVLVLVCAQFVLIQSCHACQSNTMLTWIFRILAYIRQYQTYSNISLFVRIIWSTSNYVKSFPFFHSTLTPQFIELANWRPLVSRLRVFNSIQVEHRKTVWGMLGYIGLWFWAISISRKYLRIEHIPSRSVFLSRSFGSKDKLIQTTVCSQIQSPFVKQCERPSTSSKWWHLTDFFQMI